MGSRKVFVVLDHASHNILGEYGDADTANALVDRLVEADPSVADDLDVIEIDQDAKELP